ncbi:MAG: histidinol-phosphatase [Cyclobacteriaceae bacterium]|nr:histidinol-phosphatase [Cyclobacteriaceae bacterium]MDH4297073.1 histidinol-phosphatase [Cyclobacteriaceae bacterium]MDH5249870.1 histidinol-phosphatase [Cyclobacteriaceae bacterium]
MWTNFHTHNNYCDGKGTLEEYVKLAKAKKMLGLGFSSHAPLPFPRSWCMKPEDLPSYLRDIALLKSTTPEIEIYTSLEIDFIPGIISPDQYNDQLDYTIGSIHFVENLSNGTPWEIDGPHALFLEGLENIFHGEIREAIIRYFELTREMIEQSNPTIIGHLDKIKIQNPGMKFWNEQDQWYQLEIAKTIDLIADSNAIVEVNTRGIYQQKSLTTYPSPWVLELVHKKNIPITLSSDAHHPNDIINQFPETARLLLDIGFKSITIPNEGNWRPFLFNTHGIIH